jgi:uncharacterized protein (TIGR03435 family)
MRLDTVGLACLFCSALSPAQTPNGATSALPTFDVAAIKLSKTDGKPSIRVFPGGRTVATNATLKYLIGFAYGVRDYQIIGGSKWVDSTEYDVAANPTVAFQPSFSTRDYAMKMMQSLLEDRFRLTVRRTQQQLPVYLLTVGKDGLKLKDRPKPENPLDMRMSGGRGLMTGTGMPIKIVIESLSSILARPVNDGTGLTGYYDFRLEWNPDDLDVSVTPDHTGPSLFTAIQDQLGLKLESRRGPVEVLSIDTASQPSEN